MHWSVSSPSPSLGTAPGHPRREGGVGVGVGLV